MAPFPSECYETGPGNACSPPHAVTVIRSSESISVPSESRFGQLEIFSQVLLTICSFLRSLDFRRKHCGSFQLQLSPLPISRP